MSGLPTVKKNHRESLICYQETHILLEVPSTDFSLSMGELSRHFSLAKGWPLSLAISGCLLLVGRLSLHDFVCDRVLFSLNKEFIRYCEKKKQLHFGVRNLFFFFFFFFSCFFFFCFFFLGGGGGEFPVFLRIFWSGVVGAIDTFVPEYVANMMS